jgi:hypothetical protein
MFLKLLIKIKQKSVKKKMKNPRVVELPPRLWSNLATPSGRPDSSWTTPLNEGVKLKF